MDQTVLDIQSVLILKTYVWSSGHQKWKSNNTDKHKPLIMKIPIV